MSGKCLNRSKVMTCNDLFLSSLALFHSNKVTSEVMNHRWKMFDNVITLGDLMCTNEAHVTILYFTDNSCV